MTLLTVQGAGAMVAGLLFPVLAGRGPDSLVEPPTSAVVPRSEGESSTVEAESATAQVDSSTVEVGGSVSR
jgi:hypothetical protein